MPQVTKTIEYRRALWLNNGHDLEQLVRRAWEAGPSHSDRTILRMDGDSITGLSAQDFSPFGFAIHCGRYRDGQGVGIIPMAPAENAQLGERTPDPTENFLSKDFCAIFKGNHVICLNAGRSAASARDYLIDFFKQLNFQDGETQFSLERVGDVDKLRMIEAEGVSKVDLMVDISDATALVLEEGARGEGIWSTAKHAIAEAAAAIFMHDDDTRDLRYAEKGTVTVSIDVKRGDLATSKHALDRLATEIAEDGESESFQIHLRNGQRITSQEVAVQKRIPLERVANSVSVTQAWQGMASFMRDLINSQQIQV